MAAHSRPFAVVTGGTSGIGRSLARRFLAEGFDVLVAADRPDEHAVADTSAHLQTLFADLATTAGVRDLYRQIQAAGRPVDALAANAGIGSRRNFFDQDRAGWHSVLCTNVIGTLELIHLVGRDMRAARHGRILITSSIAAEVPGPLNAVYNASKSFMQSFSFAIRNELRGTGVTVTALLPGPTDTDYFARAGMLDSKVARGHVDDPDAVAKSGYDAMMRGDGDIIHSLRHKLEVMATKFFTADFLASQHRRMAGPDRPRDAD